MFSEDEQTKLCGAFNVDNNSLQSILDTSVFILEQAAYHTAKPAVFTQQLKNIQLSDDKASASCRTRAFKSWAYPKVLLNTYREMAFA